MSKSNITFKEKCITPVVLTVEQTAHTADSWTYKVTWDNINIVGGSIFKVYYSLDSTAPSTLAGSVVAEAGFYTFTPFVGAPVGETPKEPLMVNVLVKVTTENCSELTSNVVTYNKLESTDVCSSIVTGSPDNVQSDQRYYEIDQYGVVNPAYDIATSSVRLSSAIVGIPVTLHITSEAFSNEGDLVLNGRRLEYHGDNGEVSVLYTLPSTVIANSGPGAPGGGSNPPFSDTITFTPNDGGVLKLIHFPISGWSGDNNQKELNYSVSDTVYNAQAEIGDPLCINITTLTSLVVVKAGNPHA